MWSDTCNGNAIELNIVTHSHLRYRSHYVLQYLHIRKSSFLDKSPAVVSTLLHNTNMHGLTYLIQWIHLIDFMTSLLRYQRLHRRNSTDENIEIIEIRII